MVSKQKINKEIEDAFDSTVEVHTAAGEVVSIKSLGTFDPDEDAAIEAPKAKTPAQAAKAKERVDKYNAQIAKAKAAADAKAKKVMEDARAKAKAAKEEGKKKAEEAREAKRLEAEARKEAKAKEREEAKAKREAERAQAKRDREQKALRERGLTGDEASDNAFLAVVDHAQDLAVQPFDAAGLRLPFLQVDGVALTTKGLTLPENLSLNDWTEALKGLVGIQDVAGFAIGDALNFGEGHYGRQSEVVSEALGIAKSTVKNYRYVSGLISIDERVEGLSFTHHLEIAGLYSQDPSLALNLLNQAYTEKRPVSWLRQQVSANRTAPTAAQRKQEAADLLITASNAQREADLAQFKTPAAIEREQRKELNALLDVAQRNDLVSSEAVVRNVARLQAQVQTLKAEVNLWKQRYEEAHSLLSERDEAVARVLSEANANGGAAPVASAVADEDVVIEDYEPTEAEINAAEAGSDPDDLSWLTESEASEDEDAG